MNVWTVILAAGQSARFGGVKVLAKWKTGTLLENAISMAVDDRKIIVVTGAHAFLDGYPAPDIIPIQNDSWEIGMGTSIAAGIACAQDYAADIVAVVPVDQPFVTRTHMAALSKQALQDDCCVLTKDGEVIGPPAAIPSSQFSAAQKLTGNGLKYGLAGFKTMDGRGMLRDVDTPDDLLRLSAL